MTQTSRTRKVLLTMLVVGAVGAIASFGVFSAFSSSTTNSGNEFRAGTVVLTSNDGGQPMYSNVTNNKPGTAVTRCITVAYSGSLASNVRLYTTDASLGSLAQYVDVTVTPGHFTSGPPAYPSCTNWTADGSAVYSGTLANFQATKNSFANGVTLAGPSASTWSNSDSIAYQFSYTVEDNNSANGGATALTTGVHSFKFEAQNN